MLILGNGAFKPNMLTQVGELYPPGDPRRDRAAFALLLSNSSGGIVFGSGGRLPNPERFRIDVQRVRAALRRHSGKGRAVPERRRRSLLSPSFACHQPGGSS
jgi:hypothetical protein